jgi:fibronectin-binding autotransporter adhesin
MSSGAISGTGGVLQFGTGNTILTAVNTYSGPTFVNAGTLSVNGSIASSPVSVNFGGTLSPGNSVGTLTRQRQPRLRSSELVHG